MTARLAMVLPALAPLAQRIVSEKLPRLVSAGWDAHIIAPAAPATIAAPVRARIHVGDPQRMLASLRPDLVHLELSTSGHRRIETGSRVVATFGGRDTISAAAPWPSLRGVHCYTESDRSEAARRGLAAPAVVIPPVIASPSVHDRAVHADPLRVLAIAPLHWTQGHEFALEAIHELVRMGIPTMLRIVGDGEAMVAVAFARHQFGLESVVELMSSTDSRSEHLSWADVFIHIPVVDAVSPDLLEAQAVGLPAVVSDAPGLRELISPGETGLVVPRRSPRATADALAFLARDADRRRELGDEARRQAVARYSAEATTAAFGAWYHQILRA